jgi:DNA-binding NtrC family response regulator
MSARLMASKAAGTNQIVVDDTTREEVGPAVEFVEIPGVKVKGRDEPITVHQPVKESKQQKQADKKGSICFVGRKQEVAQLDASVSSAAAGAGKVICIEGKGGMGKSALISQTFEICDRHKMKAVLVESPEFERNTVSVFYFGFFLFICFCLSEG